MGILVTILVLNLLIYGCLGWYVLLVVHLVAIDGFHAHISHDLLALAISGVGEDVFQAVLALTISCHLTNGGHGSLLLLISEEVWIVLVCLLARQALAVHLVLLSQGLLFFHGLSQLKCLCLVSGHDIVDCRAVCTDEDVLGHVNLEVLSQGLL